MLFFLMYLRENLVVVIRVGLQTFVFCFSNCRLLVVLLRRRVAKMAFLVLLGLGIGELDERSLSELSDSFIFLHS